MIAISSIDLYLSGTRGVLIVDVLQDTTCGIYPVYYAVRDTRLMVATSVASLVLALGDFQRDSDFGWDMLAWHSGTSTIDTRIKRLVAFEKRSASASVIGFTPTAREKDVDAFIAMSVAEYTAFVQGVEERWPERHHVVLVGGKDSQLIMLVPKRNPGKWHVMSMLPNAPLVQQWLQDNSIVHGMFFGTRPETQPDADFVHRIAWATDCMADPRHMRAGDMLEDIAEHFEGHCVFWAGTAGDALHARCSSRVLRVARPAQFWASLRGRVAEWQGIGHQHCINRTGCPMLSLYHSPGLWANVYRHYNPRVLPSNIRERIGETLAGRKVEWQTANPSPGRMRITREVRGGLQDWYESEITRRLRRRCDRTEVSGTHAGRNAQSVPLGHP